MTGQMRSPESCGCPILADTIERERQHIANDERLMVGLLLPEYGRASTSMRTRVTVLSIICAYELLRLIYTP